jgi:hypothetical protein
MDHHPDGSYYYFLTNTLMDSIGYGHFEQGDSSSYTGHMDVKHKLASINRVFDWYWLSWSYQEIETD